MTESKSSRRAERQKGYVLFTVAAAIIAICGFAGLVVDVGYGEYTKRQAQAAADAGAKAAALAILAGQTSNIRAAALQDTANNGFTNGVSGVTVTVNHPPLSGSYASNNGYAEVLVSKSFPTTFMSALGISSMSVSARAVGGGGGSGGACVYALDPSKADAMLASGSAVVNASCGITVESSNVRGLEVTGSGCITGSSIQVVGNYNGACFTPTPTTGITSPGDPFSGKFPIPTPSGCTATGWKNGGSTLSPGTYCGGITISGISVTANPGLYIIYGGGLTVSGGGNLSGTGVTFFNMDNAGSYKPIVISGGSASQLSAPASGTYEALLFWQDPNLPSGFWNQQNTVSGGGTTSFQGIIYLPNTPLYYSGGSSQSSAYTILVADTLNFSGSSTINQNYSSLASGSPIKTTAVLAE